MELRETPCNSVVKKNPLNLSKFQIRGKTSTQETKYPAPDMKMQKEKLFGKTLNELIAVTKRVGLPGFAAKQIADWLYKKEISSLEDMTNLSKKIREAPFSRL